jgi:hypothetical protein
VLHVFTHLYVLVRSQVIARQRRLQAEHGQATAEYALVLLGVAALALLVLAWAGGTDKIGELLDAVIDSIIDQV